MGLAGVRNLVDLLLLYRLSPLPHGLVQTVVSALPVNTVRIVLLLFQILLPHHHILAAGLGLSPLTWPIAFGLVASSHIHATEWVSEQGLFEGVADLAGGGAEGEETLVVLDLLLLDHGLYLGGLEGDVVVEALQQVALDNPTLTASLVSSMQKVSSQTICASRSWISFLSCQRASLISFADSIKLLQITIQQWVKGGASLLSYGAGYASVLMRNMVRDGQNGGVIDSISLCRIEQESSGIIFEFRWNISLIMLELKVTLPRAMHHSQQEVKCNGSQYVLPLPLETYRFVEITQEIVFKAEQEGLIILLSGKRDTVPSFDQFYKLQDDGIKYFNLRAELNFDDLALKFLSETDKILIELDSCRFPDLLALLRKAYDTYAQKLHSKINRRIKKYLTLSTRSESQKKQIKKLLDLIKAESTDEEVEEKPVAKKESPVKIAKEPSVKVVKNAEPEEPKKEQPRKVNAKAEPEAKKKKEERKQIKQVQKKPSPEQMPPKKDDKPSNFYEQPKKDKNTKKNKVEHHKHQDNEEDWEDVQSDDEVQEEEEEQPRPIKEKKKQQAHKKKEEQIVEDEWEDIHDEKMQKRQQKNLRRKHEKFDVEGKKQNEPSDRDYDSSNVESTRREREPRRNNNGNGNGNGNKNRFERSKEKTKKDLRVLLGLNGDTDDGWRERGRVQRVPAQQVQPEKNKKKWVARQEQQSVPKSETNEKDTSKSPFQKVKPDKKQVKVDQAPAKKEEPNIEAQKVVILPSQGALQKVFSFPADGKSFVLDPSKEYRVRVNNSFWIMLEKSHVKIEKDKAGYIREGKFSSSEETLIEAQDMTISLSGMCNLEDGGVAFGNPNIQEFTGTDSQWFHLKELQVYAYK